jgi:NADH-quinone oxidoreductase subunit B
MAEPLGARRARAIEAREARDGKPLIAPGAMPSSYRFDKTRRAEWIKAVEEGREEQLRIENWMHDMAHRKGGPRD